MEFILNSKSEMICGSMKIIFRGRLGAKENLNYIYKSGLIKFLNDYFIFYAYAYFRNHNTKIVIQRKRDREEGDVCRG